MINRNRLHDKKEIDKLDLATRVELEAQITDGRAAQISIDNYGSLDLPTYVELIAWRRYLFDFLGDVRGKRVLDVCCGYSMTPVLFALAGAREVVAVDVAPLTLQKVQQVAELRGVADRMRIHCGPVEQLPFEDASFDIIYGGAALHHLELEPAARELSRLLRKGGRGGFQDPLGHNLLIEFARDYLPYRGKHPQKGTDKPMRVSDIQAFGRHFATCSWRGFGLVAMLERVLPIGKNARGAVETFDDRLMRALPFLQRYGRFAVTCVTN